MVNEVESQKKISTRVSVGQATFAGVCFNIKTALPPARKWLHIVYLNNKHRIHAEAAAVVNAIL